jgi:HPt (histidine-containing phosphotransfer) domain-containing protein
MINWERVNELRDEVGSDDFLEVVDLFLEEVEDVIERLKASPDPAAYEADLHFLRGSAVNLGFDELGDVCAKGEKFARQNNPSDFDLTQVFQTYELSMALFLAGSAERNFAA